MKALNTYGVREKNLYENIKAIIKSGHLMINNTPISNLEID